MRPAAKRALQMAVGAALLVGLLTWVDLDELRASLATASVPALVFAFVLVLLDRVLMPIKWNMLLWSAGIRFPWWEAIKVYFISTFLGIYLPPTVGGDAVRAYYVSRHGHGLASVVSSIVVERLLGMVALFLFGAAGCSLFFLRFADAEFDAGTALFASLGACVLAIAGFALSLSAPFGHVLARALDIVRPLRGVGKIADRLERLYQSYLEYRGRRAALLAFVGLSLLEVFVTVARVYVIGRALGVDVPLTYYVAFVPVILALIRLPISFDGFGIQEGGFVYFLGLMGVTNSVGLSLGIVNHFLFLLGLLPGGLFYAGNRSAVRQSPVDAA